MRIVLTAALVILASQGRAGEGLFPYEDPAAVAEGEVVYAEYCAVCHGADLEGEADWRTRGADGLLPAPPHDETGHTWHHPDKQLFELTKYGFTEVLGRRGLEYESTMIGFGDVLTDSEILAVLAYIKSTWPAEIVELHNEINADQ